MTAPSPTTVPPPHRPPVCDRCGRHQVLAVMWWRNHRLHPGDLTLCGYHTRTLGADLVRAGWRAEPVLPPVTADPATH